ncbi:MAG: hypothetical protein IJ711_13370, partial [Lachnospiraceae bacterium]|nr:hypothetical protein [Lachnospiraceae bacterium]
KFPFAILYYTIDTDKIDVNVHPTKMEIRIQEPDSFFFVIRDWIKEILLQKDLIPEVMLNEEQPSQKEIAQKERELTKLIPEPFEKAKAETLMRETGIYAAGSIHAKADQTTAGLEKHPSGTADHIHAEADQTTAGRGERPSGTADGISAGAGQTTAGRQTDSRQGAAASGEESDAAQATASGSNAPFFEEHIAPSKILGQFGKAANGTDFRMTSNVIKPQDQKNYTPLFDSSEAKKHGNILKQKDHIFIEKAEQMDLSFDKFFEESTKDKYQLLGQIFETYWLITCNDKLFIMDQHAAHEKVMYEKFVKQMEEHTLETQQLNPPIILSMTQGEQQVYRDYEEHFASLGFLLEEFGGNEYALREVPLNLYGYEERELFLSVLDSLMESPIKADIRIILEKIASMSCKAAVKGNQRISVQEAQELVDTLFTLENPYNCPHGRPTVISMSKYEIEKKFKRIV